MRKLLIFSTLFTYFSLQSQLMMPLGTWGQELPFGVTNSVSGGHGRVIWSGPGGLTLREPDNELRFITRADGLSGTDIARVDYDPATELILVSYVTGRLDIIVDEQIRPILDIEENQTIQVNRRSNHVFFHEGIAYISTDFGLVTLELETGIFPRTLFSPFPIFQSLITGDGTIYIATEDGIFRQNIASGADFQDINRWELLDSEIGISGNYVSQAIVSLGDVLYADINTAIHRLGDGSTEVIIPVATGRVNTILITGEDNNVYCGRFREGAKSELYRIDGSEVVTEAQSNCHDRLTGIYVEPNGMIWLSDLFSGYRRTSDFNSSCQIPSFNTPTTTQIKDMELIDGELWVTAGGASDNFVMSGIRTGSYVKDSTGIWRRYGQSTVPALAEVFDHFEVVQHPTRNEIYIGTGWSGLLRYDGSSWFNWDDTNSILRNATGDTRRERVFGIAFDSEGNLWMTNFGTDLPLKVLRADGSWDGYPIGSDNRVHDIAIDAWNNIWMASASNENGLVVYQTQGTETASDDTRRSISAANDVLPTNLVTTVVVDRDDAVWVGTHEGIVVYNCGPDVTTSDCRGVRPRILKDGFLAFLLGDQKITSIAVDPANRKYIGTENGLFLVSEDGDEEIANYTTSNSPLISDGIIDIEIDTTTGLVYIGTERGIMTLQGEAIEGRRYHQRPVVAYPNPVPPDYDGPIAIRGLGENASVKITDINGRLVYETRSLGSQAIWDGRSFSGRRVASGVYYVLGATASNGFTSPDGVVAKIVITR